MINQLESFIFHLDWSVWAGARKTKCDCVCAYT